MATPENSIDKRSTSVFFTFGRFQPPTIGHGLLIQQLSKLAEENDSDAYVFISSTQDKKKNPLTVYQKEYWLKKMFPIENVRFINTTTCPKSLPYAGRFKDCKTIFAVIDVLLSAGYKRITMCVGSDRVPDFQKLLSKYSPEGVIIEVIGLGGKRNNTATNVTGVSGTKMRNAALRNNLASFSAGTGLPENSARVLMEEVKSGLRGGKTNTRRIKNKKLNRKTKSSRK